MGNDMEKLLQEAFDEIAKEEYANRPTDLPEHKFSLKFRLKMRRIMKGSATVGEEGNHILGLHRSFRTRRRVAVVTLFVFIMAGGTVFGAEPIIQWLNSFNVEQNEDHVKIQNNELDKNVKHTKDNFRKYCLTEVPEGYSLKSEDFEIGFQRYKVTYVKAEDMLFLKQTWQEDLVIESITSDAEGLKDIEVNGFKGYYTEDDGIGSLILSNGVYKLVLTGAFGKDELVGLAGKLELVDEPLK